MNAWRRSALVLLTLAATACTGNSPEAPATEPEPEVSVTVAPIVTATMHAYVTS